jgi:hypothetical protein
MAAFWRHMLIDRTAELYMNLAKVDRVSRLLEGCVLHADKRTEGRTPPTCGRCEVDTAAINRTRISVTSDRLHSFMAQ